jgi:hypothetical protein
VLGLPALVTARKVNHYFNHIGKDENQLEAELIVEPLRHPLGSLSNGQGQRNVPGAHFQLDNMSPPFANMKSVKVARSSEVNEGKTKSVPVVVPSLGGYKDAVIALDVGSGFAKLEGRITKKDPHRIVERFIAYWINQWGNLTLVTADKEFVTKDSQSIVTKAGTRGLPIRLRQSVPGDHRRYTALIEGCIRWIQDTAQGFMNRLRGLVKVELITALKARSYWFHALS